MLTQGNELGYLKRHRLCEVNANKYSMLPIDWIGTYITTNVSTRTERHDGKNDLSEYSIL
jgi:hypothetical protein